MKKLLGLLFDGEIIVAKQQHQRRGGGGGGGGGIVNSALELLLGIALALPAFVDAVEDFAHVLDLLEQPRGDVDRPLLRARQRQAITRPRIHLDELLPSSFSCARINRA